MDKQDGQIVQDKTVEYEMAKQNQNNNMNVEMRDVIILDKSSLQPSLLSPGNDLYLRARLQFIRKYSIFDIVQLAITAGMCFLSYYCRPFLLFQAQNYWLTIVCCLLMIICCLIIFIAPVGRRNPWNLIILLIFTLCEAYFVSYICSIVAYQDGPATVVYAAISTLAIVVGLTFYAIFTRVDFRILWGILVVAIFALIPFIFISIFSSSPILTNAIILVCVIILGIYLVWDTKMVVGGEGWFQLEMDEYAIGALILYIDIIRIFLYLLMLFGRK